MSIVQNLSAGPEISRPFSFASAASSPWASRRGSYIHIPPTIPFRNDADEAA